MKFSKIAIVGILTVFIFSNLKELSICFQKSFIEVYFSDRLDTADLAKIKTGLSQKEIKLNYDYLKFGDDGKLVAIKYHVTAEKFGGSDEADNLNNEIGFIINTSPNRKYDIVVGPRGGDEVNIIRTGKNYGWPVITYGVDYSGQKMGDGIQQKAGMEQPVYYWDPVISPSGIVIKNNKIIGKERLLTDKNQRFREVTYLEICCIL